MTDKPIASKTLVRRLLAGVVFGFIVLLVLMLAGDIRQVAHLVIDFNWAIYPLVLALTLFNYALRFIKWHYYLGEIGVKCI